MTDTSTQMILSVGILLAGSILLVVALLSRYAGFRELLVWVLARMLDPDRWGDDAGWDELRRGLVRRLDALSRIWMKSPTEETNHSKDLTREPVCDQHALADGIRTRAYRTSLTSDGKRLIKTGCSEDGNRVLVKESKVIGRLHAAAGTSEYKAYLPRLVRRHWAADGFTAIYDAAAKGSYTGEQIRQRHPGGVSGRHVAWMFNRVLEVLGFAHQQGTVHAAVMPQHLLFDCETHGLRLTDWTHAKRVGDLVTYVPRRYRKWYPDTLRIVAEPSLDIYMAAKSARYLAGVDPGGHHFRGELPLPIDRFLRSCLIESARMRPSDAWLLHQEFRELLESVYGEPKYCSLVMS